MRIFITNDDGVYSPGLYALAKALADDGHKINIVAPQIERSGAGHSMTMFAPIEVFDVTLPGLEHIPTYAISGTPVDCVKVGIGSIFKKPDIVMTGINTGTNLGCDIYGSGTVNSAAAGVAKGLPAIALSIAANRPKFLETGATIAVKAVHNILPKLAGENKVLISINIPDLPKTEIKGVKITPMARANPDYPFTEYISPRNRRWYWDSAAHLNVYEPGEDVDERWLREDYITITPLHFDINDWKQIDLLKNTDIDIL